MLLGDFGSCAVGLDCGASCCVCRGITCCIDLIVLRCGLGFGL